MYQQCYLHAVPLRMYFETRTFGPAEMAEFGTSIAAVRVLLAGLLLVPPMAAQQPGSSEDQDCNLRVNARTPATLPRAERTRSRPAPPRQITIGKITYTIELVKEVPPASDAPTLSGKACDENAAKESWCDSNDRIYLRTGRTLQKERTTLLHEIQHIILGTDKSDDETTYHQFIYELSPTLLQVLQDNPDLYLYLTAPEREVASLGPRSKNFPSRALGRR
jgi:hypothetical protein